MSIKEIIFHTIYGYPGSYYWPTLEESRRAVLHQIFMVLGNGIKLQKEKGKYTIKDKKTIPKGADYRKKILAREKLYEILKPNKGTSNDFGRWFPNLSSEKRTVFESELTAEEKAYPIVYSSKKKKEKSEFIKFEYPEKRENEIRPYPFCFYYLSFVEINPHYKKYSYDSVKKMTVEELRESKLLISAEYSAAIVEIYSWALEFFRGEKFWEDSYYNWKVDQAFITKVEAAKKEGKLASLQKDYNVPPKCVTAEEISMFSKKRSQKEYVEQCRKIIEAFS